MEVKNVLNRWNIVFVSSNGENKVGKSGLVSTWDLIDLVDTVIGGSSLLDDVVDDSGGSSNPRGSSIGDDLILLGLGVGSDGESVDGELPVGFSREGNICDLRVTVDVVKSSVGNETSVSSLSGLELAVKPDGEELSIKLRKDVLHGRDDFVDGKGGPSKTKDSVHRLISEDGGEVVGNSELLLGDGESSEAQDVSSQVTTARSRSILNGESTGFSGIG